MTYTAPTVTDLGSVRALTQQLNNKNGPSSDAATQVIPTIVGSLVPL